jgi:bacteriocin biosynthesis cyclodehydratase domain-containing protein
VDDAAAGTARVRRCGQSPEVVVRPVLKPALRLVWRGPATLQIGVRPETAVVLGNVNDSAARLLAAFDGATDDAQLRETARRLGLPPDASDRLLALLRDASVVDDAGAGLVAAGVLPPTASERLGPDLASISLVTGAADAGGSVLDRRTAAVVRVVGGSRIGATLAALLAAAGIGRVEVDDPAPCRAADCAPGGLSPRDVGAARGSAVERALAAAAGARRAGTRATGTRATRPAAAGDPDLVVVTAPPQPDAALGEQLLRAGAPHLVVYVRETAGVIGPLVVPGRTACLRCLDLHRCDRDAAWPMIAAQLAVESPGAVHACDVSLATLVASVAALQALSWIDRDPDAALTRPDSLPATCDGTLEISLPDWRLRRRAWSPHPACGCHWPGGELPMGELADVGVRPDDEERSTAARS